MPFVLFNNMFLHVLSNDKSLYALINDLPLCV